MVIENVNISKNNDGTFMMRVFIDNNDEKVEVILDRVMLEDFIIKQEEFEVIEEIIMKPKEAKTIATKGFVKEFHVDLKGIALLEEGDKSDNVGRIIKYPKETID